MEILPVDCCEPAVVGEATNAPLKSVRNSRRLISAPDGSRRSHQHNLAQSWHGLALPERLVWTRYCMRPSSGATMRRRDFLGVVGATAAAWPLAARAQQGERKKKRIGVMISRPEKDAEGQGYVVAFQRGLEQLGWTRGRSVEVDYRFTAGSTSAAQALAKELVALRPDVLVINSTGPLLATRQVAGTIPIVMAAIADPVAQGFVQSLERPGGNITGFGVEEPAMGAKWVELLKEIAPSRGDGSRRYFATRARRRRGSDVSATLNRSARVRHCALDLACLGRRPRCSTRSSSAIAATASASCFCAGLIVLPASAAGVAPSRVDRRAGRLDTATAGGLRILASFVSSWRPDRLTGPSADRPVSPRSGRLRRPHPQGREAGRPAGSGMPTKFELAINLKTAKALGPHRVADVACPRR